MKFFIYHPSTGKNQKPTQVECKTYDAAKAEYQRLQERYPSLEMSLVAENEYGERSRIHSGRWD